MSSAHTLIAAGTSRNIQTGKFCRLAAVPAALAGKLGAPASCGTQVGGCSFSSAIPCPNVMAGSLGCCEIPTKLGPCM
jgi:hypothetical protein